MSATPFKTLRSFAAASSADAAPNSASALWVDLGVDTNNQIEVRFGDGALTGSPTSVTLSAWRKVVAPDSAGSHAGEVAIDRVLTTTIAAADVAKVLPQIVTAYGRVFTVTLDSFTGGTSPTLTMTVQARFVQSFR